jgi:predicted MFS family arabinose efflux permease
VASSERFSARQLGIVFLIASVQFVNVLDFVMVMPLGPDFAKSLGFSEARVGLVGGAYTAAASVAGLLGSLFLDRFDRRKALFVAMLGLVTGTVLGGFAVDLRTLIGARVLAGLFGGPATALSIAIVSDAVPNQLRGRALGIVFGAFSLASIFGVPLGLWLGELNGWRTPFFSVAGLGVVVTLGAVAMLPPMTGHLEQRFEHPVGTLELVRRPLVQTAYLLVALVMMAGFIVIPNISGYLQLNLGVARDELKYLYFFGGIASFIAMQAGGWLVDKFGSFRTGTFGSLLVGLVVLLGLWMVPPVIPPVALFALFMTGMALRNVSYSTLVTKVPETQVRARYQSLSSAVQHASSALAAILSSQLMERVPRVPQPGDAPGRVPFELTGMQNVAALSMVLTLMIPLLLWKVESALNKRKDDVVLGGEPVVHPH